MSNKSFFSWHHPVLEIAPGNSGLGVRTRARLAKGIVVARMGGYVMTLAEEQSLARGMRDIAHQIDDNFVIGPRKASQLELTDRLNHSCDPNLGFFGQIMLVTMKVVRPETELTFDYAMVLGGHQIRYRVQLRKQTMQGENPRR